MRITLAKINLMLLLVMLTACGGSNANNSTPPSSNAVVITPASAMVQTGATQQFTTEQTGVTWSINGNVGGNSTTGLISTSGLYTAPTSVPSNPTVTITAQTSSASGNATVTVGNSTPPPAPALALGPWEFLFTTTNGSGAQTGSFANATLVKDTAYYVSNNSGGNVQVYPTPWCGALQPPTLINNYIGPYDPNPPNNPAQGVQTPSFPASDSWSCLDALAGGNNGWNGFNSFSSSEGFCAAPSAVMLGQQLQSSVPQSNIALVMYEPSQSVYNPDPESSTMITGTGTLSSDGTTISGTWSVTLTMFYTTLGPSDLTYYTFTTSTTSPCGAASGTWTATTTAPPLPTITSFQASPSSITAGQSSTLTAQINGATSASINNGVGSIALNGGADNWVIPVSPTTTTTYTLTVLNLEGSATAPVVVTVQ